MNDGGLVQNTAVGDVGVSPWSAGPAGTRDAEAALPWGKRFQQTIITIHRWIGIVACLMMLVWFVSGVVLAYVRWPAMDAASKLQVLGPVEFSRVAVTPQAAILAAGLTEMPNDLRLEMSGAEPVYRIIDWEMKPRAVSAVTGERVEGVSGEKALAIVREQLNAPQATLKATNLDSDQWTITGYWNKHRPFHHVALNDARGTEYYVSVATGEIVLDTQRWERGWNWLGAIPHWLYFEFLRHYSQEPIWTWTIYILAGAGIFVGGSGLYIGISRMRLRARYSNGRWTPFSGWMKWHHIFGIVGGITLFLWIVSGFLTMYPGGFIEPRDLEKSEFASYAGSLEPDISFAALPVLAERGEQTSRITLRRVADRPVAVLEKGSSRPRMVDANTGAPVSLALDQIGEHARVLQPAANVVGIKYIESGDEYWHSGFYPKKTPMVRVQFDDPAGSWYHIDPETGLLTGILDNIGRIDRWSVVAIHDVDLHWLLERRPLWDIVLFALIIPGVLIVITSIVISYRRLQHTGAIPAGGSMLRGTVLSRWPSSTRSSSSAPRSASAKRAGTDVLVAFASQTGTAELLANKIVDSLHRAGRAATVRQLSDLDSRDLVEARLVILVVATTGDGDAPDRAMAFRRSVMRQQLALENLQFALLALGSREYRNFCGFGRALETWLRACGAKPAFAPTFVSDFDPHALDRWAHQLSGLTGRVESFRINLAPHRPWILRDRRHLNPGSAGGEAWHIELEPREHTGSWEAGDIAQIVAGVSWRDFANGRADIVEREFSIASTPRQGRAQLLVRKLHDEHGRPGRASGSLTTEFPLGEVIPIRLRPNPSFRAPQDDCPMILIGNGTGLAGLRSHLLRREELGHHRNWLIFGERNAVSDSFYAEDIKRWRDTGVLSRVDLVFSRDGVARRYVQHVLAEQAADVRRWVDDRASIYMCGNVQGMAPAVTEQLATILGEQSFEGLIRAGRYRRDVY